MTADRPTSKPDDRKFLAALLAVLLMAGGVVYSAYQRDLRLARGPVVDLERIQALVEAGKLTLHEAEWYEPVAPNAP